MVGHTLRYGTQQQACQWAVAPAAQYDQVGLPRFGGVQNGLVGWAFQVADPHFNSESTQFLSLAFRHRPRPLDLKGVFIGGLRNAWKRAEGCGYHHAGSVRLGQGGSERSRSL